VVSVGESLTLTCTVSSEDVFSVAWTRNRNNFTLHTRSQPPQCSGHDIIPRDITVACPGNRIYTATVSSITRNHTGDIWKCREFGGAGGKNSNEVRIQIRGKLLFIDKTFIEPVKKKIRQKIPL